MTTMLMDLYSKIDGGGTPFRISLVKQRGPFPAIPVILSPRIESHWLVYSFRRTILLIDHVHHFGSKA